MTSDHERQDSATALEHDATPPDTEISADDAAVEIDEAEAPSGDRAPVQVEPKPGRRRTRKKKADAEADVSDEAAAEGEEAGDEDAEAAPAGPCADLPLAARLEALLVSTDRPLNDSRIGTLLGLPGSGRKKTIAEAIEALNAAYDASGRTFRIERLAGGWQILTRPHFGPVVASLHRERQETRLSPAALETLSIIAYRQPVLRAEIEAIRGVASGEVLRGLMVRRLVKIVGRAEVLGRPMLYGTTKEFLRVFGLATLDDLPAVEGLPAMPTRPEPQTPDAESTEAPTEPVADAAEAADAPSDEAPDDETTTPESTD